MLSASSARSCLLLLLSTAALLLAAAVEDVRYSVHAGLHYRAVRKVLATTAGHANFSVDLTAPIAVPLQTLLGEFEKMLLVHTPEFNETIGNLSTVMADAFERIDRHFHTAKLATRLSARLATQADKGDESQARARRDTLLYPVGNLIGSVFGFSTYDDVELLEYRDLQVQGQVDQVKKAVVDVHSEQQRQGKAVNSLVEKANAAFVEVQSALNNIYDNTEILRLRLTQVAMMVASLASVGTDKLLNAQRMYSIHTACSAGLIPMEAVRPADLEEATRTVTEMYKNRVKVAVSDLEMLYKLEIATCVFSGPERLNIIAKLPLLPADEDWTAVDVVPLGFLYHFGDDGGGGEASVCRLLPHAVMAAFSADGQQVRVMSQQERAHCLANHVCEVPRLAEAAGVSRACITGIRGGAESLDALRRACTFTCAPYRGVEVTRVQDNWYSVVNMDRNLAVSCPREYVELPRVREGALGVEVPCDCEVVDTTDSHRSRPVTLVSSVWPCHPSLSKTVVVQVQVPALWTSHQDRLASLALSAARHNASRPPAIDRDWVIKIETLGQERPLNLSAGQLPLAPTTRPTAATFGALPGWASTLWLAGLTVLLLHLCWRSK